MKPKPITRNGVKQFVLDARGAGAGRYYGADREICLAKYRAAISGLDEIEFTDEDRIAKRELGQRGSLLAAVRFYLGQKPAQAEQSLLVAAAECVAAKKKLNLRAAYTDHLEFILGQFHVFAGAETKCSHVSTEHVQRFLDSKPWAGSTLCGMRNRLATFFAFCVDKGYAVKNPVDTIKSPKLEKKVPTILSVKDCESLLKTALEKDRALIPYLVLGIFCGLRPEEIERLPVSAVRLEEGIVDIPASVSKTRDRRLVDLSSNALAWLAAAQDDFGGSEYFITYRSRRRNLAEAAGVVWSSDVMRHSFASYHIELHQSADKTALQLGHQGSTKMLFRHYKATVTRKEAEAFWALRPEPVLTVVEKVA